MTKTTEDIASPEGLAAQRRARVAGVLWLVVIFTGIFSEMIVRGEILVRNDGAATSLNIIEHQMLFRIGVVSDITATACYLAVVAILFGLLRPAGHTLSNVAAAFGVAGSAISGLDLDGDGLRRKDRPCGGLRSSRQS